MYIVFIIRLRAGCLDLESETGRWRGINKNRRICTLCNDEVEYEIHFLFHCCKLEHIRNLYSDIILTISRKIVKIKKFVLLYFVLKTTF